MSKGRDAIMSLGQIVGRRHLHGDLAGGHGEEILATLDACRGGRRSDPR